MERDPRQIRFGHCLYLRLRARHVSQPLHLSNSFCDETNIFSRNQGTGHYGQNLAASGSSNPVPNWDQSKIVADSITNSWYNSEYQNFAPYYNNPSPPSGGPEYLHFTQVVWKESQSVGCASVYCQPNTILGSSYGWYTVCNYFPAGELLTRSP